MLDGEREVHRFVGKAAVEINAPDVLRQPDRGGVDCGPVVDVHTAIADRESDEAARAVPAPGDRLRTLPSVTR